MKKVFKKALSATIGFVLAVTLLSGCGGQKEAEKPESEAASNTTTGTLVNTTGLPIVNQPTTYKIMLQKNVSDKTTWADKECVKKAEAETGLKFDWVEVQSEGWNEKVTVTLASGDLPDVIIGDIPSMTSFLDSFIPLDGMLDTYAPSLTAIYQQYPQIKVAITQGDGKIYSLPLAQFTGFIANEALSINKAWLDKLNLPMPETTDELYNVLKAFKERDPNGNGQQDEIPYGYCEAVPGCHVIEMAQNFGIINDGINNSGQYVMVDNGKVIFIGSDNRFYDYLKYMNMLYKDGLIDLDGFVQKNQDYVTKGRKDLYGLITHSSYDDIIVGVDNVKNFVPLVPMKDANGNRVTVPTKVPGFLSANVFKITTKCKNPEAMVRLWDYVNSSLDNKLLWSFGPENAVYTKQADGKLLKQSKMPEGFNNFAELRQTLSTGMAGFWFLTVDDYSHFAIDPRDQKLLDRVTTYSPYFKKELIPIGQDTSDASGRRDSMFTEIDTYMQNFIADSILNGIDDTKWNANLDKLNKLNTKQFVEDYQAYYDRSMQISK